MRISPTTLLNGKTATGAGERHTPAKGYNTYQANGLTSAGAGAATIDIEVSNNGVNWEVLATITLTLGTTSTSDGFSADAPWAYIRGNVTAISGTDATVSLTFAGER